jgi:hypothetical protein
VESPDKEWSLTGIYGEPRWQDKYKTWDKLRELKGHNNLPWVVIGDFNEIAFSHEKDGGNTRPPSYMQAFRDALSDCELEDLGYSGDPFTWKRGRMRQRLDRAVATQSWLVQHPGAMVKHLGYIKSDHWPILLDTDYQTGVAHQWPGPRWFEAKWLRDKNLREVVQNAWNGASHVIPEGNVLGRLSHLHGALHDWDNSVLKAPKKRLWRAQREFEKAVSGIISDESEAKAKEIADLIEMLLEQEEVRWFQRSRANWLQQGDRNTSFFHNFASARREKNYIKKLKNSDGDWVEGTDMLNPLVFYYFSNLFTSEVHGIDPKFLEKIMPRVTPLMNERLTAPFTADEVQRAAFSIGDFKAPGPDGIHTIFYKKFWDLCGDEIAKEVLHALNTSTIPEGWNDTIVFLIPKLDDPELVTQFRPISLCNVIYKTLSKLLASRLKEVLPEVISPMQSAFVPGRLITDNVLVAYESVHAIKNKRSGAVGTCAVKIGHA